MSELLRQKWGLPNWEDPAAYQLQRTQREWRWEFIRRHPELRSEWERAEKETLAGTKETYGFAADFKKLRRRFGLSVIPDPARECSDIVLLSLSHPRYGYVLDYGQAPAATMVGFDLSLPLAPQLKKAKQYLTAIQREVGKPPSPKLNSRQLPSLLRVLDAVEQGAGFPEIARTLWPRATSPRQTAQEKHKAAVRVRDQFAKGLL